MKIQTEQNIRNRTNYLSSCQQPGTPICAEIVRNTYLEEVIVGYWTLPQLILKEVCLRQNCITILVCVKQQTEKYIQTKLTTHSSMR